MDTFWNLFMENKELKFDRRCFTSSLFFSSITLSPISVIFRMKWQIIEAAAAAAVTAVIYRKVSNCSKQLWNMLTMRLVCCWSASIPIIDQKLKGIGYVCIYIHINVVCVVPLWNVKDVRALPIIVYQERRLDRLC